HPAEGSPQETGPDRGQGDQVPSEDRSARLRHQEGSRRAVPPYRRAGQGDHHVPRARDGPHRARTQDLGPAGRGSRGSGGCRGPPQAGRTEHGDGPRAVEEAPRTEEHRAEEPAGAGGGRSPSRRPARPGAGAGRGGRGPGGGPAGDVTGVYEGSPVAPVRSEERRAMPKQKTHRATAKRFRITRTGKVLHRKATGNHFLRKKSGSRRRRVEGMTQVTAERTNIRRLLGK